MSSYTVPDATDVYSVYEKNKSRSPDEIYKCMHKINIRAKNGYSNAGCHIDTPAKPFIQKGFKVSKTVAGRPKRDMKLISWDKA